MNYYYSLDGNDIAGPYSLDDLKSYLASGAITRSTRVCAVGTQTWQPLASILRLSSQAQRQPPRPIYTMDGVGELLEVYADKVCITPRGVFGFLSKGLKGTKTIPFTSITAIQFREAGRILSGFIQFTIPGGNESRGGLFDATEDENTFMFADVDGGNYLALQIKNYIETEVQKLRTPRSSITANLSDELQKLAQLNAQGVLSDTEFNAAKKRLLG